MYLAQRYAQRTAGERNQTRSYVNLNQTETKAFPEIGNVQTENR